MRETDTHIYFWSGIYSNWYKSDFEIAGQTYNCCEQYMMAEKARLFKDEEMEQAIMITKDPSKQKAMGRNVRNFDQKIWEQYALNIVYQANYAKFSQNPELKQILLDTGEKMIVEASPTDTIWGVGLHEDDPLILDESNWKGRNWLGIAIMNARMTISFEEYRKQNKISR